MKMGAMGQERALLRRARLRAHAGSQTYACSQAYALPSPPGAPVILGRKEADCTGMVGKIGLKEHFVGKFSFFFNLGTEVGCCPL